MAEVLITLGIIGIIAALTIPSLVAKYQEKVTITQVKKMYSVTSQAYSLLVNEHGGINEWDTFTTAEERSTSMADKFKSQLKVMKDCGYADGCFPNVNYKHFAGGDSINFITDKGRRHMVLLSDGSAVAFYKTAAMGVIYYDINGFKAPNQFGVDLFEWDVFNDRIVPWDNVAHNDERDALATCLASGYSCTAWVLANENMDYMHCPDELNWDSKTKCD